MALAADTTAQERAPTLVEYATAGAMTLVAIVAASPVYITRQFGVLVTALAVAGVPASILWRHIGIPRRLLNISVFSIATAMGVAVFAALAGGGASAVTEGVRQIVASERLAMMVLIQVFVWIAAFRCWTLTTARDSPLSIVPAASILILAAVMIMRGVLVAVAFAAFFLLATLSVALYMSAARATGRLPGAHVDPQMQAVLPAMLLGLGAVAIAVPVAIWLGSLAAPQRWRQEFRTVATVRLATLLVYWSTRPSIVPATNVSLGDTPAVGERMLFRIKARALTLWRTDAFARYDGSTWYPGSTNSFTGQKLAGGWWSLPAQDPGLKAGVSASRISQQLNLDSIVQGVLPAAFELHQVRSFDVRPRINTASQATLSRVKEPGAVIPMVSLRKWPLGLSKPAPAAVLGNERRAYLAYRGIVPPRVVNLAREICRRLTDPVQKVKAIEKYISDHCRYSLRANPPPPGHEATEWFLFSAKEGWCDHFASAAAVLCRCAGVPARLVTGYWSDELDEDGWCVVREKHAHAWAEAFIDGYGWLEVNPSAQPLRELGVGGRGRRQHNWLTKVALPRAGAAWRRAAETRLWLWAILAACATLGVYSAARSIRGRPPITPLQYDSSLAQQFARECYLWMKQWLAARGHAKQAGQTASEYVAWLRERLGEAADAAATIVAYYRGTAYVGQAPSASQVEELRTAARALARRSWHVWWAGRKRRKA